jgi:hypothetical protein
MKLEGGQYWLSLHIGSKKECHRMEHVIGVWRPRDR